MKCQLMVNIFIRHTSLTRGYNFDIVMKEEMERNMRMYSYHMVQWLLFLYIYCFLGWVWESCYVSVKSRRWINRGFMHGPYLPIYGFGAIAVLLMTIPVKENLVLVYLFGMIGATVLEYITGAVMEHLFHVRYWDYSKERWNLNGHICLKCSLAWGAFSILMVRVIHCPIESLVYRIPAQIAQTIAFVLTVVIAVDFTQSFNEAMDLKELLENLTEANEEIRKLRRRLDVVIAIADDERKEWMLRASSGKHAIEEKFGGVRQKVEQNREEKSCMLTGISERLNVYLDSVKTTLSKENREDEFEKVRIEVDTLKESIRKQMTKLHSRSDKEYVRSLKMLRRNPNAVSRKYADALDEVKKLDE